MDLKRTLTIIGFAVTFGALALQIVLTVNARLAGGDSLLGALLFYFSYFTILTNLGLAAAYLSELVAWRWLASFRRPVVRTMLAGAIALVGLFYHFFLAGIWSPQGPFKLADVLLHYVNPLLYLAWWLWVPKHGGVGFRHLPAMLLFPGLYLVWALLRGTVAGEYPYPVIDVGRYGYPQVAVNSVGMLAGFVALFLLAIAVDQWLARRVGVKH